MAEPLNIPELNQSAPAQGVAPLDIPELRNDNAQPLDIPELKEKGSALSDFNKAKLSELEKLQISGQAAWTGVLHFGSTLAKAVTKPFSKTAPKAIQDYYDRQVETLEKNKAAHPELRLGVHEFVGSIVPTLGIPGGGALKAAQLGGRLGAEVAIPTLGKIAGSMAGGAAEGAAYGSLFNQYGQDPNQILNPEGAKMGAQLGGILGSAQLYGQRIADRSISYEALKNQARDVGYKGPVFERDLPSNSSYDMMARRWANKVFDNLPLVFGTAGGRQAQREAFRPALVDFLSNRNYKDVSVQTVKNEIQRAADNIHTEESRLWQVDLKNAVKNSELTNIPLATTKTKANELLDLFKSEPSILGKSATKTLNEIPESGSFDTFLKVKRDLWDSYASLAKLKDPSPDQQAAQNGLRELFWQSVDDFKTVVQNDHPKVLQAFEAANTFTQGAKSIFDPKNNSYFVDAIEGMKKSNGALEDYINWVTGKNISKDEVQTQIGVLGKKATDALGKIQLNKLLDKSLNPNGETINLSTWLRGLDDIKKQNSGLLSSPAVESMEGLTQVMRGNLKSQQDIKGGAGMIQFAAGTALLGTGLAAATGNLPDMDLQKTAMLATPIVLSIISRSPVKNTLRFFNGAGENPKMSQYLYNHINRQLNKAGIIMQMNEANNELVLKHKSENEKK